MLLLSQTSGLKYVYKYRREVLAMTRRNDSKLEHRLEENRLNDARRRENEEKEQEAKKHREK